MAGEWRRAYRQDKFEIQMTNPDSFSRIISTWFIEFIILISIVDTAVAWVSLISPHIDLILRRLGDVGGRSTNGIEKSFKP